MLPSRSICWLLSARLTHDLCHRFGDLGTERSSDGEMVKPTVGMAKRKH